jgi:hypothetical protein
VLLIACTPAVAPTPQVIYITPEPSLAAAISTPPATATPTTAPTAEATTTPAPTAAATPAPTAEPTPAPTPKPMTYASLSNRAWAKLVKAPDRYTGKGYELWACISQFDAATGDDMFRGQALNRRTSWWWSDGDNAMFEGDAARLEDFVAEDIVVMKVVSEGSYSYDTQAGGNTTVPLFEVRSIKRKGSCE